MINMKYLLRLIGVLAITTGTATSVIACDNAVVTLKTVLTKADLGNITVANKTSPTEKEIKTAIEVKNLGINLAGIKVVVDAPTTGSSITSATVKPVDNFYTGDEIKVNFNLVVVTLKRVLTKADLGNITVANKTSPTEKEIKTAIEAKNHDINIDGITVTDITTTGAIVKPVDKFYSGDPIPIEFTLVVGLDTVLTQPDLDNITVEDTNISPTVDQIKTAIEAKNHDINLDGITVTDITTTGAIVKPVAKFYSGDPIPVTFTL